MKTFTVSTSMAAAVSLSILSQSNRPLRSIPEQQFVLQLEQVHTLFTESETLCLKGSLQKLFEAYKKVGYPLLLSENSRISFSRIESETSLIKLADKGFYDTDKGLRWTVYMRYFMREWKNAVAVPAPRSSLVDYFHS